MAVGRLRLYQATVSHTLGSSLIYTTCTLDANGVPTLTGTVGGYLSSNPQIIFKSGRTVPLLGVISYGTPTSATSLSKIRTLARRSLFYVAVGMQRSNVPTKFFAAIDPDYWVVQQNQGTVDRPEWVTIPYRNRAVRIAPTITASRIELLSGRSITYPPTPISPPPTPPVTPEPEEEDEEEEEEEEEETPVTPTPTGLQAIINTFLQSVLTAIRNATTTAIGTITTTIPTAFATNIAALTTAVKGFGDKVEEFAEDAASTVRTGVQAANTGLINAYNTGQTAVRNALTTALTGIKNAISTGLTSVGSAYTNAQNRLTNMVQRQITQLSSNYTTAVGRLRSVISLGQTALDNRLQGIRTGIAVTLPQRIRDLIGAVGELRTRIGTNLTQIARTVRETMDALILKVGGLALDLLGDIRKSGMSLWEWVVATVSDSGQVLGRVTDRILGTLSDQDRNLIREGVPQANYALSRGSPPPLGFE